MRTKKGYRLRPLGKEYILVAEGLEVEDANQMISMNATAAFLWEAVEGKDFDAETLAQLLVDEYGIDSETAKKDVKPLLQTWKDASIIN
jgi:hypothetical protein